MTTDRYIIQIPTFPGFYDSWLSQELDAIAERDAEWMAEREGEPVYHPENYVADPALRLDAGEYCELFATHADHSKSHDIVAREYVDAFALALSEVVGFNVTLEFESLTSPREYNFSTDRLFAYLDAETGAKLHALALADRERLAKVLADKFTSYDGFHSHYSAKLEDWVDLGPDELDHNGWLVMLTAVIRADYEMLRGNVEEYLLDGDGLYHAWEAAIDWPEFARIVADERDAKLAELRVFDPYYEPAYRCPVTPDMFRAA